MDMGNADPTMNITIPSVFITNADGQELQRLLKDSPVLLSLNATGETTLRNPTFWDMFLTFLDINITNPIDSMDPTKAAATCMYGDTCLV